MINYEITDLVKYQNYAYLDKVIKATLKHEKVKKAIFSIVFVDKKEIRRLNQKYRNIDKVTDVISFAFEDNQDIVYNNLRVLGDIYICIPKMKEQATSYGHSEKRELAFLVIHGLLHLLGYNHETELEEKIMFELQELILNDQNIKR